MPFLYPLDVITYVDGDGNRINTVVTNHTFSLNGASAISAVGETATKNSYSTIKGLTKKEVEDAIAEAMKKVDTTTEYFHVKYSVYENGKNGSITSMTDKITADTIYLGTCATNSKDAPATADSYNWVKIRGANGKDGKGISEVINYYLTTDKSDGVTRADFGENTEIVTPDKEKPYLWNYEEIRYTSGSPTYTEPCIIGNFAENGSNGRGIKSITEYYLTTQTESTPSKLSFKSTVQTPTETLPFLWNYEKIEYTDDSTPYESAVRLIGVYGSDGQSLYTWVKYADDVNGNGMSDSPSGKKYIGISVNQTSSTESNNAGNYKWSLIKGDNGRGVSKVVTEYYLSTSETTQTGGSWSEDAPTWVDGKYLWTRLATTYTDGETEYSDPVVDASWKKTSVVDEATEELNSALAGALGLHKTELDGTIYYHTNSVLQNSTSLDVIFVLNSSGFGVCKSGWSNENLTFSYGVTTTGQAVWDIITAHKISADLVEAGSIKSLPSAKVQTEINLDDGTITSTNGETRVHIHGGSADESGATKPAGIVIESETEDKHFFCTPGEVSFTTLEYLVALFMHELIPNKYPKPEDPYFSSVAEKDIKTTNIHCKNIFISIRDGEEGNLIDELSLMSEQVNLLSESLTALQEKYLALEDALGQQHEHTASTAVREKIVPPTCTAQGSYDSVVYCATCGEEISRTKVTTQATGHTDINGDGYCDTCGVQTGTFYTITVQSNNTSYGTVSGGGSFLSGKATTIVATAKPGYRFVQWNDGNTNATRTITVTGNKTYTATFEVEEQTISVGETKTANIEAGKITYFKFVPSMSGIYEFTSLGTSTTEDVVGYLCNANKEQIATDDDGAGNRQFKLTQNLTAGTTYYWGIKYYSATKSGSVDVKLTKEVMQYTINTAVSPLGAGQVTGGGTYEEDTVVTLTATPNNGYAFLYWTDGNEVRASERITVFATKNQTWTAMFEADLSGPPYADDRIVNGVLYIGTDTTSIGQTYRNNNGITKAIIPNNVVEISEYAFMDCANLKIVELNANITLINIGCFAYCTSLAQISIPSTVTRINDIAFQQCKALKTINIPITLTGIGDRAFAGSGITDIYYEGTKAQWAKISNKEYAFDDLSKVTIHCSDGNINDNGATKKITFYGSDGTTKIVRNGVELITTSETVEYDFSMGDQITLTFIAESGVAFSSWINDDTMANLSYDNPYTFVVDTSTPTAIGIITRGN